MPAGVDVGVDGVGPWLTPAGEFYRIDTALTVPSVDPSTWSLRIHGMVEQEVTLTWDELLASDLVEAYVTLACVSNPVGGDLISNQKWLGLPIKGLLEKAKPTGDADMVLSTSVDGFTAGTPLAVLMDGRDALLAIAMDGQPLPFEHGFPVRMVVPGLYGYVSATKWVKDLEVTRFADAQAYWTQRGWSEEGPIKTQSRIDVPKGGKTVPAGSVVVAGTAWAQHRGVKGVQVRVDDGAWNDATLAADGSIDSWRQWTWTWDASPGDHKLYVRAFDPTGPQTGAPGRGSPTGRPATTRSASRSADRASVDVPHVAARGAEVLDVGVRGAGAQPAVRRDDLVQRGVDVLRHARGVAAHVEMGAVLEPRPKLGAVFAHLVLHVDLGTWSREKARSSMSGALARERHSS